jgi:hypothetical protein
MQILSADLKEQLRKEVEESVKKDKLDAENAFNIKITSAVQKILSDIEKNAARIAKAEDRIHWKTVIDNINHVIEVLPAYNVRGNAELSKLIEMVRVKLGSFDKDNLQKDSKSQAAIVASAKEIENTFADLF